MKIHLFTTIFLSVPFSFFIFVNVFINVLEHCCVYDLHVEEHLLQEIFLLYGYKGLDKV
jgi:hypothetical protein